MLFGSMKINQKNHLEIGGIDVKKLAHQYGTPLYVYDQKHIEDMIIKYQKYFQIEGLNTEIIYASKAFMSIAMCQLIQQYGIGMDVVSGGELYTAKISGFDMSKIYFHGNNKSIEEITMAFRFGVGQIVVDNYYELQLVDMVASKRNQPMKTLLRVNPGIEAHTHEYVQTSKFSSKFGESIYDEEVINQIMETYKNSSYLILEGFHCHIGSQILETSSFLNTVDIMVNFANSIEKKYNTSIYTLNLGGGFGVYYKEGDKPIRLRELHPAILNRISELKEKNNMSLQNILIEPGRAIVCNAGTTLYTVGGIKETYGGKKYIFVDGGMTDNIRPALYQADYSVDIATKMKNIKDTICDIAGKCCESGDIIAVEKELQDAKIGDIVAVYSTGAYTYSMASNYNRLPKPAVVFVKDGNSQVVVKRESYEDLVKNDQPLKVQQYANSL